MSDQQWPPRQPGGPRPPYRGQQPFPGPRQPYPGQQPRPMPQRPQPRQPRPYPGPQQPHPGGQRHPGQRPYPEQPYPQQPYPQQQPYDQQSPPGPQPPPYPRDFGPGRFGPEPAKKRRWPKVLVTLLLLALVGTGGYGAYDFYEQTQKWEQTTTDDVNGLGSDLSVAVASLRSVGWEVTGEDIATWLEQPGDYGDGLRLRTLQADEATDTFSVAGYRTWQDTYAKQDHTTVVCTNITLATGTQRPLAASVTTCPESVPETAPTTPAATTAGTAGAGAQQGGVTGHLAELTEKAHGIRSAGTGGATEGKLLEVAAPTKPVGDLRSDSTDLVCAPGTKALGEGEGYDMGKLIPVRLCAVEGLPNTGTESTKGDPYYIDGSDGLTVVNARISGAAVALVKKAEKQGIDLVAGSSFRTMKKQKALCKDDVTGGCPAGDYTLTAQPGHSSHQLGIAIDFEQPSTTGGKTCATRASEPSSAVWRFLDKTALSVGLKQYAPEAWHWDAYGGKDRCAPMS